MFRRALLLSSGLVCAWSAPLRAADDLDVSGGAPVDIIVNGERPAEAIGTGSKTGVDPRDVPAAIAVVPEQIIAQQAVRTLDETLTNASAVAPSFGGGYGLADNYVVRGLPVRFLRDGLPDGSTFNGYRRTLSDVATIEVLKGPGSALYGRGEAGGTVNIVTKAPRDTWGADFEASYGRFDSLYLTGDVGGPLTADVSSRLIGHYERTDGFRGLARRSTEVLPTLAVELGTDNRLTLDYDYRDIRTTPDNYGIPFTVNRTLAAIDPASRLYSPFNRADQAIHRFTIADVAQVSPILQLRGSLIYDTRALSFVRNASGNVVNAAGVMTGRNGRTQSDDADYWTGQAEAVLTPQTGNVKHTILLGVEYSSIDIDTVRKSFSLPNLTVKSGTVLAVDNPAAIGTATLNFDRAISSDTLSVYAQEQADIADRIKLRAGLRYDAVKLVDDGINGNVRRRIAGSPGLLSWQAGAVFKASDAISFYGGYGRGKFVAINTESASLSPIPEQSSQVEAGVKATLFNGKLNASAAVFETRRDHYFITLVPGADPVQAGKQRSRGVELDVLGNPIEGLSLIGNFAYVDAVNRSSALASVSGLPGATNLPVLGKELASTPRTSGSLWANYEWLGGTLKGLSLGAGVTYKASVYVDSLELLKVPSYAIGRAAIGYKWRGIEAQLTVSNITNKRYFVVPTFVGAQPGEPRSVQITLRTSL